MTLVDVIIVACICAALQVWMSDLKLLTKNTPIYTYLTGHLVHLNWKHWIMNMLALVCLPLLLPKIRRWQFWVFSILLCLGISALLLTTKQLQIQHLTDYVGFSGVLHGLYALFALLTLFQLQHEQVTYIRAQSGILITGLLMKTAYEMSFRPTHSADYLGAAVVYAAHMDGVILGIVGFMLIYAMSVRGKHKAVSE